MQRAAIRDGPNPTAVCGLESQPSPWPLWSCLQAGAAKVLEHPHLPLWEPQEAADSHPLPHAAHGSSELGRGCLGVSGMRLQDKAAAGTAPTTPGHKTGALQGKQGFEPQAGMLWGPTAPGALLAAAAQPLALAQPRKDFTNFAHFWQTLENVTGVKGGDRQGEQILPHTGLSCGCGRAETFSSSRAPHGHDMGLSCAYDPVN